MKEYLIRTHNPLKHNFKEKVEKGVVLGAQSGGNPVAATPSPLTLRPYHQDNLFTSAPPTTAIISATLRPFHGRSAGLRKDEDRYADARWHSRKPVPADRSEELEIFLKGLGCSM